jgi:hypothetical protein
VKVTGLKTMHMMRVQKTICHLLLISIMVAVCQPREIQADIRPKGIFAGGFVGFYDQSMTLSRATYFGLNLGYHLNRVFVLELTQGAIPVTRQKIIETSAQRGKSEDLLLYQGAVNLQMQLNQSIVSPYLGLGLGTVYMDQWMPAENLMFGAKWFVNPNLFIKPQIEMWIAQGARYGNEPYEHFMATIAIHYQFGGNRDMDSDRLLNVDDECPALSEDYDGFEDEDGCPEPDNDMDKIEDHVDQCKNEPEDIDQDRDEDGCPDIDDDQDGIKNEDDQCKNEPETKNNIKDGDGCPD